jgi:hypothetical protein
MKREFSLLGFHWVRTMWVESLHFCGKCVYTKSGNYRQLFGVEWFV